MIIIAVFISFLLATFDRIFFYMVGFPTWFNKPILF